jgi:hypothetical protein
MLLGDEAQVDARYNPFGDSANLDARYVHGLCRTYHMLRNHFGCTRWNSLVTWAMWDLVLVRLETVLALSPRSIIGCVQNNFHAYGTFGANHAGILHRHKHCLQTH